MAEFCAVARRTAQVPLEEYAAGFVDVPKFEACCAQCPNYAARWTCPPYDFDPMEVWGRYSGLTLHARVLTPLPGADFAGAMADLAGEKDALLEELLALEGETPGSLALSSGGCTLCETCTRQAGAPCRHPEKLRWSIEALGGDVGRTAEVYLGLPLVWAPRGELAPYYCLVGGLLTGDRNG